VSDIGVGEEQRATITTSDGPIELAYQSFGPPDGPVFLLITGWFSDLTLWPSGFCETLADQGYRVIRYDNRDAGLSTRTDVEVLDAEHPPYTMSDLAADAIGLLDSLGIAAAHIAGFAYGGTISHLVAIEHPSRVLSLVPMATASGARTDADGHPFVPPDPSVISVLAAPFPEGTESLRAHHRRLFAAMAGGSFDEAEYSTRQQESADRGAQPARGDLQRVVGTTAGDRSAALGNVVAPALVVHPELDPLVSLAAAETHAAAFANGKLLVLEGIGHGVLPRRHWAPLAAAMDQNAKEARL
jgi:pimeloyl-ACP methyl ester carboxylesterase